MSKNLFDIVDKEVLKDVKFFFNKLNERYLYSKGITNHYDDHGVPALHESVEYFSPQILADDRMVYIANNIALSGLSQNNIICNTIISHFYGGRGIHQVATKEADPKKALVDFERLLVDEDYKNKIITNLEEARNYGIPIYGTTELRTSLFGAANEYCANKYNKERDAHSGNILLWVASFIERGITEKMQQAKSLKEMYGIITQLEGVGQYYGYHCSTSNSVNPNIKINHDEHFCIPGPGARKTLDLLFPNVLAKEFEYGDRVVWIRQNQKELLGEYPIHESLHNLIIDGVKIFEDEQNELKVYGTEVACCQAAVYHRLKNEPKLAGRRKVARIDESVFQRFINNEKIDKTVHVKKSKKEDDMKVNEKFNELPEEYIDPFPEHKLQDPSEIKRLNNIQRTLVTKINKVAEAIKKSRTGKANHVFLSNEDIDEKLPKSIKETIVKNKIVKDKVVKKTSVPIVSADKIELIMSIIKELGKEEFGHTDVLEVVLERGGLGLKLESNWKESWAIMQSMVNTGLLEKIGRKYKLK